MIKIIDLETEHLTEYERKYVFTEAPTEKERVNVKRISLRAPDKRTYDFRKGADDDPEKESISRICISALDQVPERCKDCECLVKREWKHGKLKNNENVICSFEFTVEQLRRFVDWVYELQSKSFSKRTDIDEDMKKMCAKCPYDLVGAHHAKRNNTV